MALDLVDRCTPLEGHSLESVFRASTYSRALADGKPWDVHHRFCASNAVGRSTSRTSCSPSRCRRSSPRFFGTIERDHSGRLQNAAAAGDICAALLPSSGGFRKLRLADVVSDLRSSLPAISAWQDDAHEIQRGWKILGREPRKWALGVGRGGRQILLSLLARGLDENPYAEFEFEPDYFDPREVHLLSFNQRWQSTWADMTIEEWVRWLSVHWGIQRHLGVALRKLRGERRDTFRIRPLEQELRVIEVPPPAATVPRLGKAFQILRDLDLTDLDADGRTILTGSGRKELEACLA